VPTVLGLKRSRNPPQPPLILRVRMWLIVTASQRSNLQSMSVPQWSQFLVLTGTPLQANGGGAEVERRAEMKQLVSAEMAGKGGMAGNSEMAGNGEGRKDDRGMGAGGEVDEVREEERYLVSYKSRTWKPPTRSTVREEVRCIHTHTHAHTHTHTHTHSTYAGLCSGGRRAFEHFGTFLTKHCTISFFCFFFRRCNSSLLWFLPVRTRTRARAHTHTHTHTHTGTDIQMDPVRDPCVHACITWPLLLRASACMYRCQSETLNPKPSAGMYRYRSVRYVSRACHGSLSWISSKANLSIVAMLARVHPCDSCKSYRNPKSQTSNPNPETRNRNLKPHCVLPTCLPPLLPTPHLLTTYPLLPY
jgi:hypothetical protein